MQRLSKSEFMSKVINDKYAKKLAEEERLKVADRHAMLNCIKTNDFRRRKRK